MPGYFLCLGFFSGSVITFCVLCFVDLPFYRAAQRHLATSREMLNEQRRLFEELK
jgi:hypothetical protein